MRVAAGAACPLRGSLAEPGTTHHRFLKRPPERGIVGESQRPREADHCGRRYTGVARLLPHRQQCNLRGVIGQPAGGSS